MAKKITVLVPNNPKRPNTAARDMYARYEDGMTDEEYVRVIHDSAPDRISKGLPGRADQGRRALLWDLERRFISLG